MMMYQAGLSVLLLMAAAESFTPPSSWTEPYPAFRVVGNLYGVGTEDLAAWLITTEDGHILINTGLEDSTAIIQGNMESLGFELEDIKILLTQ